MSNGTFYTSLLAAAAVVAVNTQAKAEEPGTADLMQLINEDLDQDQQDFTLELVEATGAKIEARMARKIENVFEPLTASTTQPYNTAQNDTYTSMATSIEMAALSRAEFEVGKDVANIESPFEPRLPMPPAIMTFAEEVQ